MKHRFSDLGELKAYLSNLLDCDLHSKGNWTVAQILYHLASAFEASVDGLPAGYPKIVRHAIRPFRWVVTRYRFPPYLPIPAAIQGKLKPPPAEELELRTELEHLLLSINRFETYDGDLAPHPVLGRLTCNEWIGFHLRHCEHHLSLIEP